MLIVYLIFSTIITPTALNKSRTLIKQSGVDTISNLVKPNIFADTFKGLTFYIGEKNNNEVKNIFIKDDANNLNNLLPEKSSSKNQTIYAESGIIDKNRIILEKGIIQSYENDNTVRVVQFNKTLLNFENLDNRVIKDIKIQETSTIKILNCFKNYYLGNLTEKYVKNCPKNNIAIVIETFSRRLVMPFYIPLIALLISFSLIYSKNKKTKIINRYLFSILSFFLLVISELSVRYSGISNTNFFIYSITPFILMPFIYIILIKKFNRELK